MSVTLFDPLQLGDIALSNRVVMAPMTRSRASEGDMPNDQMVEYYRQRATAGLIITEGVHPSKTGKGYCRTPGLFTDAQVAGWRKVTDAVHAEGGKIVAQLMHVGRVAARPNKDADAETVAPSAIRANVQLYTDSAGMVATEMPRALETREIPGVIAEYAHSARCAMAAGFDGVELHCASGYLPAQFLHSSSNQRTDAYGGSVLNRIRFVVETLEALAGAIGAGKVGYRICPGNPFNDVKDDNPAETFGALLAATANMGLSYLHAIQMPQLGIDCQALARPLFRNNLIINESFDLEKGRQALADGQADAVAYGRLYISNPDLVRRFREGLPLARFDPNTLYTLGGKGYIDYPPAP
ncbi:alkene reductase [Denitratisoma sp. DHT3]|uniref:alkene reductase n=1 Tax=Denitratisoma sp. DHT3 TaxID=1981880 RepID=UPI0011985D27|nr:alkene reductase [Denitratisoma sp. DHT3]QDX80593.1 alkene reductase [Denitratisoma sp. DHT3]